MSSSVQPGSMISGLGTAVPDRVLTNFDLEKMVETSDQWIRERSGIEKRHILGADENNSDLAVTAAKRALDEAGLKPEDVECIMLATITPEYAFPATACLIQAKLGALHAAAFDLSAACSGFLYALQLADGMIRTGTFKNVLVIGSEALSRVTDWEDRSTCVLFGDGAGAAVLVPSDGKRGILSTYTKSDGRLAELLWIPAGGTARPASHDTVDQRLHFLKMEGREVFKHAVRTMTDAAKKAVKLARLEFEDVDWLIPHQANIRIIEAIAERVHIPRERIVVNLQEYGNTSSATIPLALDEARRDGRIQPGHKCLLVAFGGGFTWASSLIVL
jgi:3-oxoacyl-[acyl-carrier-protein] synthase III